MYNNWTHNTKEKAPPQEYFGTCRLLGNGGTETTPFLYLLFSFDTKLTKMRNCEKPSRAGSCKKCKNENKFISTASNFQSKVTVDAMPVKNYNILHIFCFYSAIIP